MKFTLRRSLRNSCEVPIHRTRWSPAVIAIRSRGLFQLASPSLLSFAHYSNAIYSTIRFFYFFPLLHISSLCFVFSWLLHPSCPPTFPPSPSSSTFIAVLCALWLIRAGLATGGNTSLPTPMSQRKGYLSFLSKFAYGYCFVSPVRSTNSEGGKQRLELQGAKLCRGAG